jgi:class 3 adenylate cyclase
MPTVRPALILVLLLLGVPFQTTAQLPADSLLKALNGRQAPLDKLTTLRELSRAKGLPEERLLHFAQRTVQYADTVLALPGIDRNKALSLKAGGVFNVARGRYATADPPMKDSLLAGYRRAEALWRASGDQERIAFVTLRLGNEMANIPGMQKTAYDLYMEAYHIHEARGDTASMMNALNQSYLILNRVGDRTGTMRIIQQLMDLARKSAPEQLSNVELKLALEYKFAHEHDSSDHYLLRILVREESTGNVQTWCMAAVNYMVNQKDAGRPERALSFWEGLPPEVRNDTLTTDRALLHYGVAYALQGLGRHKEALREADVALRVFERCGRHCGEHRTQTRLIIGDALMALGETGKALAVAHSAWEECEQNAFSVHVEMETAGLMERVYEALGNAPEALRFTRLVKAFTDSMNVMDLRKELTRMEWRKQQAADSARVAEEKRLMQQEAEAQISAQRNRKLLAFGGGAGVLVLALVLWRRLGRSRKEQARTEEILYNVLPEEVAREIRETGSAKNRQIEQVSVIFTDFQDFTHLSASLSHDALMEEVGACFTAFDGILARHGIEKVKTIGDAYMAAAGLKGGGPDAASRAVQAALEMQAFVESRHAAHAAQGLPAFRMRVGIHTGPVVAGIVGVKKFQYDIWGDTVNTASRMESSGEVGQVNISEATYELVKNVPGLTFTPRGKVQAKGKGEMEMFFVGRTNGAA